VHFKHRRRAASGPTLNILIVAVLAMLAQQAFAHLSSLVVPTLAPAIGAELGLDKALVGAYAGLHYALSFLGAASCGGFILRYGALRVSQAALILMLIGLAAPAGEWLPLFALSAVLVGIGSSVSTPSSSQTLARYAPPKLAPLVFSVKQTGVPVGGMMAGLLIPWLALQFGWRGALIALGLMCAILAVALQPLRGRFDADRQPERSLSAGDTLRTLRGVMTDARLLELALASATFVGLQAIFQSFFTTYMTLGLGHSLATAGTVFAIAYGAGAPARIAWGALAAKLTARRVLGGLGLVMGLAAAVTGLFTPAWPVPLITAVAIVYSCSAIAWHGVLLAEVARLAPPGQVGGVTGGVLSFVSLAMMLYPLLFAALLAATGSYLPGFALAAMPAFLYGLRLVRSAPGQAAARSP
jgi:MFS family permease